LSAPFKLKDGVVRLAFNTTNKPTHRFKVNENFDADEHLFQAPPSWRYFSKIHFGIGSAFVDIIEVAKRKVLALEFRISVAMPAKEDILTAMPQLIHHLTGYYTYRFKLAPARLSQVSFQHFRRDSTTSADNTLHLTQHY
jgi:hypothetical protein